MLKLCVSEREKIWSWWCLLVQWYHCIYTITVNIHNMKRTNNALILPWKSLSPLLESLKRSPELPEEGTGHRAWVPLLLASPTIIIPHLPPLFLGSLGVFKLLFSCLVVFFHHFFLNSHLSVYINRILPATVFQLSFDFPPTKLV